MTRRLILVRHAMPAVSADIAPARWELTSAGRRGAAQLGDSIPPDAVLAASQERKAIQTLAIAAGVEPGAIMIDSRFGEVARPGEPFDDDVAERRRAWIEGRPDDRHRSWETPQSAADRFGAGVEALDGDVLVIASHGMIITAWLVAIGVVETGPAAGAYWSGLGLPDLIEVPHGLRAE